MEIEIQSNRSSRFPQSRAQTYDWRTFFLEFLYGLLAIAWYILALAEMSMLRRLTWLGKFVAPSSCDLSKDGGGHNVLLEPLSSSEDRQS